MIDYIKDLKVGQIIDLGVSLGLSYETLTSIKCKDIHSGMVTAWLSKKDNVMETSGNPSWKSLKDALLKMGVTDVANMIMKGRYDIVFECTNSHNLITARIISILVSIHLV